MPVQIRKAASADLDAVALIYSHIHTEEEQGRAVIGWQRGVYPERETAEKALERDDLFVEELGRRSGRNGHYQPAAGGRLRRRALGI